MNLLDSVSNWLNAIRATPDMDTYTVCFTCKRGRPGNFRTVIAASPEVARALVEATTPTLGEVYDVRRYIGN